MYDASAPPAQHTMADHGLPTAPPLPPSAPPAMMPWDVGRGDIYNAQALQHAPILFAPPESVEQTADETMMVTERENVLRDWGRKRERKMHRKPSCLMDQMLSGSGLYPIRLLEERWFTQRERGMVAQLEHLFEETGHHRDLARDMLTPLMYNIDVRIVLDNSGSMTLDMFGGQKFQGAGIEARTFEDNGILQRTLDQTLPLPRFSKLQRLPAPATGGLSPHHKRWYHARETLKKWRQVYTILGLDPPVYLLNPVHSQYQVPLSQIDRIFDAGPGGRTPMTDALQRVVNDRPDPNRPMLILAITDGEADDMISFGTFLDQVQNMKYGDVQLCLLGLSLVKADIEWFEMEECDETRIRTVEPFEVEQRQIQLKEVVNKEGNYNFAMHTYRVMVTNFFPAEYDYEAHLQNLRHRLYITLHGRDRWWGMNNSCWYCVCTNILCPACFLGTCCHCNGWCQGGCGKYECPALLEGCCGEE